jgi:transposase
MARRTGRAALLLDEEQRSMLKELAGSRTAARREVERAQILLAYAEGQSLTGIGRRVGSSRPTICKCIDRALAAGVSAGLRDRHHRPHAPRIVDAAKAWVIDPGCRQPKELGLAAELWTLSALAAYVRAHAESAGHPRLASVGKSPIWRILKGGEIKPHRVRYYLERHDAEFARKRAEILVVYREVSLPPPEAKNDARPRPVPYGERR